MKWKIIHDNWNSTLEPNDILLYKIILWQPLNSLQMTNNPNFLFLLCLQFKNDIFLDENCFYSCDTHTHTHTYIHECANSWKSILKKKKECIHAFWLHVFWYQRIWYQNLISICNIYSFKLIIDSFFLFFFQKMIHFFFVCVQKIYLKENLKQPKIKIYFVRECLINYLPSRKIVSS